MCVCVSVYKLFCLFMFLKYHKKAKTLKSRLKQKYKKLNINKNHNSIIINNHNNPFGFIILKSMIYDRHLTCI